MLTEEEKRAATLAVAHYGVEQTAADRVVEDLLRERTEGRNVDLLDQFRRARLLSDAQVRDLRLGLEKTHIDIRGAPTSIEDLRKLKKLGDCRILRSLGEGGMGAVFLAFDDKSQSQVALKVLSPELARQQANLDRFYREAKTGALLDQPNIVRHLAWGQDRDTGLHYLILEYIEGTTAQELLERRGRLAVGDAFWIVTEAARALEHAHARDVIHRDIKPANILLATNGQVKLSDFGLAKRTSEASHLTQARQGFGTPYYMPYEQAMNARSADARSDIYALGATFYQLLTGEVPFPGTTPMEIVDKKAIGFFLPAGAMVTELPDSVDPILSRMMARDPAARYQTATELLADLARAGLATPVPSFASGGRGREKAPLPPPATVPDLSLPPPIVEDVWFVRYRNAEGAWVRSKLTRKEIVRRWQKGKLAADAQVSALGEGPYLPLRQVFVETGSKSSINRRRAGWREKLTAGAADPRVWWVASLGLIVVIVSLLLVVVGFMLQ